MTLSSTDAPGGRPVWLDGGVLTGEPRLPGNPDGAERALVPLRREGRIAGLLLTVWRAPTVLDEPLRRALYELCEPAARVLDWDAEVPGGPRVVAALLDLLPQAGAIVHTPPEGPVVVEHLNDAARQAAARVHSPVAGPSRRSSPTPTAVSCPCSPSRPAAPGRSTPRACPPGGPRRARWSTSTSWRWAAPRAAVLWDAGEGAPVLTRVFGRLEGLAYFEDDLLTGRSRWSDQAFALFGLDRPEDSVPLRALAPHPHPADVEALRELLAALTERHDGAHALVRVIRPDGGVRHVRVAAEPVLTGGVLTGLAGVYQDVSAQHRNEVALTASFDRLSAAQTDAVLRNRVVLQLQQAIVPQAPALDPTSGLEIAARYRPAAAEFRVGGDWYDVQTLPSGRVLVAVGDIAGHGIDAATSMVALRGALHGLCFTDRDPGDLMEWLNEVALHTPTQPTVTVLCALYDPAGRTLRWTSAGHPPPLLPRGGRARFLEAEPNILLGARPGASYEETLTPMLPGDTLLLYTDGLIERRNVDLDESLAGLRRAAQRLAAAGPGEQADLRGPLGKTTPHGAARPGLVSRTNTGPPKCPDLVESTDAAP